MIQLPCNSNQSLFFITYLIGLQKCAFAATYIEITENEELSPLPRQ